VVLSVAVGVFSIGMVAGSNQILFRDLTESWLAASPASATLFTEPFDDSRVEAVRKVPGVGWAEGRRIVNVRARMGSEWKDLQLIAIKDFQRHPSEPVQTGERRLPAEGPRVAGRARFTGLGGRTTGRRADD
jgi:putative ABC transport system permease protein